MPNNPLPPNTSGMMTDKERKLTDTIQQQNARITELYNECEHYKAEYQNAHDINAELMQRVEELEREIDTQRRVMQGMKCDKIKADMMDILMRYVHEGVDAADIGCAAVSYTDLYDRRFQNAAD